MQSKKLSVIVPVFMGEDFIRKNLAAMKTAFARHFRNFEIIAVIDGSPDNSRKECEKVKGVKVVGYSKNMGKGYALKYGFSKCDGDYITFIDQDMDLPPEQMRNFIPYMATADMVIGSKRHPFSKVDYPLSRKIFSKGFHIFARFILGVNLRDTQTGLKLIKRELLEVIIPLIMVKRYAFDLELCFLAQKHSFRVVEAPINVNYRFAGTGINYKTIFGMFKDTLAIRYRYTILNYYQKQYRRVHF